VKTVAMKMENEQIFWIDYFYRRLASRT